MSARADAPAEARDFDFLHGHWQVRNRRLVARLAGSNAWEEFDASSECRPVLGGSGNVDEFRTEHWPGFVGFTLRVFDPRTRQWSIHWVDNRRHVLDPPVRGGFAGDVGLFEGRDEHDGRPVRVRFIWRRGPTPRWEQAFSADDGETWETNWTMDFSRAGDL